MTDARPYRSRRASLTVPGSSPKMLAKALAMTVDEVVPDLEDSVAPSAKVEARANIVAALAADRDDKVVTVRVNDAETRWAYGDVIEIVKGAGSRIDCIMLPKVERVGHVQWLDTLLTQLELDLELPLGGIGIEVQIEGPSGLIAVNEIAAASDRIETLIFGPGDFMAAMGIPTLTVGAKDANTWNTSDLALASLAVTAKARGLQVIDGPFAVIEDLDGFRGSARHSASFGYDGKWAIHPSQIEACNEVYTPSSALYERSERILEAYKFARSAEGGNRGAVLLDGEMVDEATRKLALATAIRGRRAGLEPSAKK